MSSISSWPNAGKHFYAFNVSDYEIGQLLADLESYRKDIVTAKE